MIYRIFATLLLIVAITAVSVYLEPSGNQQRNSAPASAPSIDDGAMKSLRIN